MQKAIVISQETHSALKTMAAQQGRFVNDVAEEIFKAGIAAKAGKTNNKGQKNAQQRSE